MISHVLSSMDGVGIFATLPLIMFMLMFAAVLVWVVRLDKVKVERWAELPLEKADPTAVKKLTGDRHDR